MFRESERIAVLGGTDIETLCVSETFYVPLIMKTRVLRSYALREDLEAVKY